MGNRRISKLIKSQGMGICTMLAAIFMANLSAYKASAASYVAQYVGASINGTWVKVDSSGSVGIELVPTETGTLGIGKSTVTVETNANTGYRLYLSGLNAESNGYTALYKDGLINNTSAPKLVSVPTSTISPSSLSAGQWGYAIPATPALALAYQDVLTYGSTTETNTINNLKFSGVRQEYSQVKTSSSSNVNNPDNIDIYYGAMADNSTPLGSYYNVVVYTAFVEGTDNIAITPADGYLKDNDTISVQTNIQDAPYPITADQISLEFYDASDRAKDIGSCTDLAISTDSNGATDGTVGHPLAFSCTFHSTTDTERNKSYDMLIKIDPTNNGIYLSYERPDSWIYGKPLDQLTYMQDVTSADCAVSKIWESLDDDYILTDNRDNKQYVTRKLKDGRCWMTQNLDLELANDNETMKAKRLDGTMAALDETNTNISSTWIIPEGSQGYDTQTADGVYWNQRGCANFGYSTSWTTSGTSKYDVQTWCNVGYEVRSRRMDDCVVSYGGAYDSRDTIASCDTSIGVANTKRSGVAYNWVAATAGSKSYSSGAGEASGSICPKGWELPTGKVGGEAHAMFIAQKVLRAEAEGGVAGEFVATNIHPVSGGDLNVGIERFNQMALAMVSDPISTIRAGQYSPDLGGVGNSRGTTGQWWLSTAFDSYRGYAAEILNGFYFPGTHYNRNKGLGWGVRCIVE